MKIELLGTGGYFANSRRQTACLLLPEWGIAIDAGSATFHIPANCQTSQLDLFLTHPHLDHIVGLPFLLMPILSGHFQAIHLHATRYTLDAVERHLFATEIFPVSMPFQCEEIGAKGDMEIRPGVRIGWQALPSHPGGSMAYRIDFDLPNERGSFAYVTDTTSDGSYAQFIHGVDLLIHECYFDDARRHLADKTGHCCASDVAKVAASAGAKRLVVVHVDPLLDVEDPIGLPAMRSIFPQTELAHDGLLLEVGQQE